MMAGPADRRRQNDRGKAVIDAVVAESTLRHLQHCCCFETRRDSVSAENAESANEAHSVKPPSQNYARVSRSTRERAAPLVGVFDLLLFKLRFCHV